MALVGALTPLVKVAHTQWLRCVVLYTLTGSISALTAGMLLGVFGSTLRANRALWLIVPLALILAARDWEWLHFELPERKCQTEKVWAHEFGFAVASAMWGFHLGLGFTTYIKYGGFWVLTAIGLAIGDARYGAMLLVVYWLGRAAPVWVMPVVGRTVESHEMTGSILSTRHIYSRCDGLALVWAAVVALIWVL